MPMREAILRVYRRGRLWTIWRMFSRVLIFRTTSLSDCTETLGRKPVSRNVWWIRVNTLQDGILRSGKRLWYSSTAARALPSWIAVIWYHTQGRTWIRLSADRYSALTHQKTTLFSGHYLRNRIYIHTQTHTHTHTHTHTQVASKTLDNFQNWFPRTKTRKKIYINKTPVNISRGSAPILSDLSPLEFSLWAHLNTLEQCFPTFLLEDTFWLLKITMYPHILAHVNIVSPKFKICLRTHFRWLRTHTSSMEKNALHDCTLIKLTVARLVGITTPSKEASQSFQQNLILLVKK